MGRGLVSIAGADLAPWAGVPGLYDRLGLYDAMLGACMTAISLRIDDEMLALIDELCAQRGNTRTQLVLHSLDRVLAGHGLLDPGLVAERRRERGDLPRESTEATL